MSGISRRCDFGGRANVVMARAFGCQAADELVAMLSQPVLRKTLGRSFFSSLFLIVFLLMKNRSE
jgi:hypothetical protein